MLLRGSSVVDKVYEDLEDSYANLLLASFYSKNLSLLYNENTIKGITKTITKAIFVILIIIDIKIHELIYFLQLL